MGPLRLVNKDLGTQKSFVLALGKLVTFLAQVAILGCLVTCEMIDKLEVGLCNTPGVFIPLDNEYGFKHVISG
jgi:hypothetical protein